MTNLNTSDFLRAVDHAAGMNDRWLFLAAFCLLLLGCGAVIYWLVRQLQVVIEHHRLAREAYQHTQIVAAQNETALKLVVRASTETPPRSMNARTNCGESGNRSDLAKRFFS